MVVVALAGGWMTYTAYAVEEKPEYEEAVLYEWSTDPGFSHSTTVERVNPLYDVGETVGNSPVYYTEVMPELNGTYTFEYTATGEGSLDVVTGVEMVTRETGDDDVVYWSQTESLVEAEETDVSPGQPVRTEFTVDVPEVERRIEAVRSGLGAEVGSEDVQLVFTTTVEGEVNGEDVNYREQNRAQVEINENTYTVDTGEEGIQGESFETTQLVKVESESSGSSGSKKAVSPLLFLVSLGLLAGLIEAKRRDVIAPTERELIALERQEFDDWISTGTISDDVLSNGKRSVVRVDSIECVVDIAIDIGGRVIEDDDREVLSVIDEDVVYVYEYEDGIWKMTNGVSEETEYEDFIEETKEETNGEEGGETVVQNDSETMEEDGEEEKDTFERLKEDD